MIATLFQPRAWCWFLIVVSLLALASALVMQYWGGLYPCNLCMWQRYFYVATAVGAGIGLVTGRPTLGLCLGLAGLCLEAGTAIYHTGVEMKFFDLPATCSGIGLADDFEAFKASILEAKPKCDEIAATFLGLSIAAWNALLAIGLALVTLGILFRRKNPATSA